MVIAEMACHFLGNNVDFTMVSLCYYQAVIWSDTVMVALSKLEGPGPGTVTFLLSLDFFLLLSP